jgi:hypothetical protein
VVGLSNELTVRPTKGVGFGIGRAAVINQAGQIDAASGNLSDCVRVDGSSGPCGGSGTGGTGGNFVDAEVPAGAVNGSNATFTLASAPSPAASLELYRNGLLQLQGVDYQLSVNTITFYLGSVPQTADLLVADYRFTPPGNLLSPLVTPQVICSSSGLSTSATALAELGSCTIAAGSLGVGDRLEVQFQYGHTGTATGFTIAVLIGSTTVVTRSGDAAETLLAGQTSFGIYAGGQTWNTQTWGVASILSVNAGTASENTSLAVKVSLQGEMAGTTSDAVFLRNFTVIRYPAQANP